MGTAPEWHKEGFDVTSEDGVEGYVTCGEIVEWFENWRKEDPRSAAELGFTDVELTEEICFGLAVDCFECRLETLRGWPLGLFP
jgi:hypothetical protein